MKTSNEVALLGDYLKEERKSNKNLNFLMTNFNLKFIPVSKFLEAFGLERNRFQIISFIVNPKNAFELGRFGHSSDVISTDTHCKGENLDYYDGNFSVFTEEALENLTNLSKKYSKQSR